MRDRLRIAFIFLLFGHSLCVCVAQVTFRIISLPTSTPPDAVLYISGNFEGWTGGQETYRLYKDADSLHSITLPQMVGTIQYKFTRGAWTTVEKGINGEEIANRTYTYGGNGDVVDVVIHNWADLSGITSTAADNVALMSESFMMPQLNRTRKIWIYLPPDYETSQLSYPVLYMHDGQNLFDDSTAFAGEWGVDETLNDMYEESGFGLIVIGIENGGAQRINEYSPWVNPQYGGGEGEAYIDFIVETLKPYVDSTYRTVTMPQYSGLMGSSMGGLISHYGGVAEPDVFGKLGVFSPSFALFDSCYDYTYENVTPDHGKFYFVAGGLEGNTALRTQQMVDTLLAAGLPPESMEIVIDPSGMHIEAFWRREFPAAVEWLFGDTMVGTHEASGTEGSLDISVFPNPVTTTLHIVANENRGVLTMELYDVTGRRLHLEKFAGTLTANLTHLHAGNYVLRVFSENGIMVTPLVVR